MLGAATVQADWAVTDGHKMHYPQLPDPDGWDVNFTAPLILADDWRCTQTGPVSDIHFWFSWKEDLVPRDFNQEPVDFIHASIHSDIPANTPGGVPFSRPGQLLWERDFPVGSFSSIWVGQGPQSWYDPATGAWNPDQDPASGVSPDHLNYYQINIENIERPFLQKQGTIYWLDLNIELTDLVPPGAQIGWKTTQNHFNDDAVWGDGQTWQELRDPRTGESLDLAFVITPEPSATAGAVLLLGFAGWRTYRRFKGK